MASTPRSGLTIRPARPDDYYDVVQLTRDVWDGTDYVPFVWERWLEDRSGYLCSAVLRRRVVGLQHISVQDGGCAWLEGIRVDSRLRGQGIGAALLRHGLEWAHQAGLSVARLSTSSANESSTRIARAAGLATIGTYDVLSAPAASAPCDVEGVRPAHAGDEDALRRLLLGGSSPREAPFYTEGWTVHRLDEQRLSLLLATHAVVVAGADEIEGVGIATASLGRPYLRLGQLSGSASGMRAITRWLLARAAGAGFEAVRATLPAGRPEPDLLPSLGFTPGVTFAMLLWETAL